MWSVEPMTELQGQSRALCSGAMVSGARPVVRALEEYRIAFAMWLNADPRNAQENAFWKAQAHAAAEKLRVAKRAANNEFRGARRETPDAER